MNADKVEEAVDLLQQLELNEYEARCFVGLSRLSSATAKQLSEITDVPRTRVYDAIRVLEAQGLVEVQHTTPQQFRAVPLEEATETLREQYEGRVERIQSALDGIERADAGTENPIQEVWSLSGREAIASRTTNLVDGAADEVVLVLGDEALLTEALVYRLNQVGNGVTLAIGSVTRALDEKVRDAVPNATGYVSGLDWLHGPNTAEDEVAIGRLLLVDRSTILVSSIVPRDGEEHAVFGTGFGNGLVVVARRLMAQGLVAGRDPSSDGDE